MPVTIVVGLQWGDEGKGKVVDHLTAGADAVARFSGGANAGHTVMLGGERVALHQLPSGMLRPAVQGFIGAGCVVDPVALAGEAGELSELGLGVWERLLVSTKAHLVHPAFRLMEEADESGRESGAVGTTRRGIGPAYVRKFQRLGLRLEDAAVPSALRRLSDRLLEEVSGRLSPSGEDMDRLHAETEEFLDASVRLVDRAGDVSLRLNRLLDDGGGLVAEGAQGTMLDPDHGTYPYVTCGPCVSGAACASLGIGPARVDEVVGVMKSYSTRVGNGPMPTEMGEAAAELIRERGGEYGTTTGRPRRIGWADGVLASYAARLNGCSWVALTLLDVLSGVGGLRVCSRYRLDPETEAALFETGRRMSEHEPVLEEMEGWTAGIAGETEWEALPAEARAYVERLEELVGVPVRAVSTGPAREDLIWRS